MEGPKEILGNFGHTMSTNYWAMKNTNAGERARLTRRSNVTKIGSKWRGRYATHTGISLDYWENSASDAEKENFLTGSLRRHRGDAGAY